MGYLPRPMAYPIVVMKLGSHKNASAAHTTIAPKPRR
jgi:hypothetical protein